MNNPTQVLLEGFLGDGYTKYSGHSNTDKNQPFNNIETNQMASLKKFTKNDPMGRVNLTLPESVRLRIEAHRLFYRLQFGDNAERSPMLQEVILAWFDQDKEFQKFESTLTPAHKAEIEKAAGLE